MTFVTPQIFVLVLYLTVMWGFYFLVAVREWIRGPQPTRTEPQEKVRAFRRVIVSFCLFMLPGSFLLRTGLVILGVGEAQVGVILFFTLAGTNIVGSTYAVYSLRYD